MADTIGTAYVQIEPSFEGVTPKIEQEFGGEGEKAGKSFGSGFGSVAGTVGKVMAGAAAAGSAAVTTMVKGAIDSYGEFEQLQGGAELMFGKGYDYIAQKANTAFKDVQMSQNDYLTQVNGLAVGLKTALGGDEVAAAKLADQVVKAEADIVSATGNSQEAVQNAFNGIMKNNFSMLDNLGLGITATKAGMQEVLDTVNKKNAESGKTTNYVIDNVADCQAALIDYVKMQGMADYAANEGSETIQGSLASMQAAWQDLMTGVASGNTQALSQNISNLVDTVGAFAKNVMPIIQNALQGVSQLISELAPKIAEALPGLLQQVLPGLLTAGVDIIKALGEGIIQAIPSLMPTITEIILQLCNMIVTMLPDLIQVGMQVIVQLAMGIAQALPELIPTIVETILTIVNYLIDNIDLLIDASIAIITGLAEGLITALPVLIDKIPEIIMKLVQAIITNLPQILQAGVQIILSLIKGIAQAIPQLLAEVGTFLKDFVTAIVGFIPQLIQTGKELISGLWEGIKSAWTDLKGNLSELANGLVASIKAKFQIGSPSKVFADEIGQWIPAGIAEGIEDGSDVLTSAVDDMANSTLTQSINSDFVQSSNQVQSADALMTEGSDGLYSLLSEYLPIIARGLAVNVNMSPNTDRLFDMIVEKNNTLVKSNGGGGVFA